MMFTQEVLNGFEMIHRTATAEIPATIPGHRAFVGVYPPWPDKRITQWQVRKFEIPENLVDQWFGQEALVNLVSVRFDTLQEVENWLMQEGLADVRFETPWKNDWPL